MIRMTLFVCAIVISLSGLVFAGEDANVTDEVIAVVKAQWAAEMKKDMAEYMKNVAEDYTEFNPDYATRLDGKAINMKVGEAFSGGANQILAAELANPKVQVYGDVAICSYNYVGVNKDKDGKIQPARAKSTRVYVKQDGNWMLVHANFGADPVPNSD